MKTFETLDQKFNVSPVTLEDITTPAQLPGSTPPVLEGVEEAALKSYSNVIDRGEEMLQSIANIAIQAESARAFEVAAQLMNSISDATKKMVDMKIALEKNNLKKAKGGVKNQQNNFFVGTTADFLKAIEKANTPK